MDIMRHIPEDVVKTGGPPTWNYLLRPGVFTAANVTEFTLLAGAAAGKAAIEYGALKLPFYVAKSPFAIACNGWDRLANSGCTPAWMRARSEERRVGKECRSRWS